MGNYLEAKNISKKYNDEVGFIVNLIEEASFKVGANSITTILAPAGAGKSSLLKIAAGLENPSGGNIEINSPNKKVVLIPSEPSSFPWYSVRENIELVNGSNTDFDTVISLVGLDGYEDHLPNNNSAGFRFRISLAMAIAAGADVIVVDEPFKYMKPAARQRIYKLLLDIKEKTEISFLIGSANLSEAILLSDEIYIMKKTPGKIIDSIEISLGDNRDVEVMNSDNFIEYRNRIEKIIKADKTQLLADIIV